MIDARAVRERTRSDGEPTPRTFLPQAEIIFDHFDDGERQTANVQMFARNLKSVSAIENFQQRRMHFGFFRFDDTIADDDIRLEIIFGVGGRFRRQITGI